MSVLHPTPLILLAVFFMSWVEAQSVQNAAFELAPIASATPNSSLFRLVDEKSCDASVVTIVYELYTKNSMVFQTCVSEGQYKIFPFSGTHPTTQQIGDMAKSLACRAIFTSILLAGIPECEVSNFPLLAAAETLLKIGVDADKYPKAVNVVPSTERFLQMMHWRRDVNLAQAAGLPCDSQSKLYAEYTSNLYAITTSGLVRLTADKVVQYRPRIDGSFSQEQIMALPNMPGLRGSGSGSKIMSVYAADATVKPSNASVSDSEVSHAKLKSNAKQNTDASQTKKTTTSDAETTNDAAHTVWGISKFAVLAAIAMMLVLA
ncbi:unnamed protein product [Phytophthora lilii]|uniref:Unnamed protein product n=1 Tax=Phytophthora lilii TaxID=2077276 RepID=A0A9W6UCC3_9STRA|nr:unnamed protein product [Phytophthora lilii]